MKTTTKPPEAATSPFPSTTQPTAYLPEGAAIDALRVTVAGDLADQIAALVNDLDYKLSSFDPHEAAPSELDRFVTEATMTVRLVGYLADQVPISTGVGTPRRGGASDWLLWPDTQAHRNALGRARIATSVEG